MLIELINKSKTKKIKYINERFYVDKLSLFNEIIEVLDILDKNKKIPELIDLVNVSIVCYPRNKLIIKYAKKYVKNFYNCNLKHDLKNNQYSACKYLKVVKKVIKINSIIDFGAGTGAWLLAAKSLGVDKLIGIEKHYQIDIKGAKILKQNVFDKINFSADIAVSVEVGEHILPEKSSIFIDNITSSSDIVIFGAASTHQSGDAHINCREVGFWKNLFKNRGFKLVDLFRQQFWNCRKINKAYVQNVYLYVKKDSKYFSEFISVPLLDIPHPEIINPHQINKYRSNPILFKKIKR